MQRAEMSVWVPFIECEDNHVFHLGIQDIVDCVFLDKDSAIKWLNQQKKFYAKEWSELTPNTPYGIYEDPSWWAYNFIWHDGSENHKCIIGVRELDAWKKIKG